MPIYNTILKGLDSYNLRHIVNKDRKLHPSWLGNVSMFTKESVSQFMGLNRFIDWRSYYWIRKAANLGILRFIDFGDENDPDLRVAVFNSEEMSFYILYSAGVSQGENADIIKRCVKSFYDIPNSHILIDLALLTSKD